MSSKLNYLIGVSLKRKIKTKWFLFVNIILLFIIVALINIDAIINAFGGDFNKNKNIFIVDNTNISYDILSEQLDSVAKSMDYEDDYFITKKIENRLNNYDSIINEKDNNIVIIIDENNKSVVNFKIISNSFIDTIDYQLITQALVNTKATLVINKLELTEEELKLVYADTNIERIILDENKKSEEENMQRIIVTVFPAIILPFFLLIIILFQMIGAEVNDEKSTKSMEIIISNVSPTTHLFSKIVAGNLFVLIQGLLLVLYAILAFIIHNFIGNSIDSGLMGQVSSIFNDIMNSSFGSKIIYIIPLTLILIILTFMAYSVLAGVFASMTTNSEDFQQVQTPVMLISLIGYYLATMAGIFEGSIIIRILSYFPLISAILSPSLLVLEQIGIVDVIISIAIMILTLIILIKYGLRIYKVGILNYSSTNIWKKIFKAMKK